jgi:UDP-galactopyranose mutase
MSRLPKQFRIVCLSHLKWEQTLFQRPQQLMRLLSERHPVLYIAQCSTREFLGSLLRGRLGLITGKVGHNLRYVNLPYPPMAHRFRWSEGLVLLQAWLVARLMTLFAKSADICLWIYHPTYSRHFARFPHALMVYDCMDFFSGFSASHDNVGEIETDLIRKADMVFTGGKSLQRAKEGINPRTYCFPSGVEYDHFHKAALAETIVPDDIKTIASPILGYFGAIDERIDWPLIRRICASHPEWSVVFLGPRILNQSIPDDLPNFNWLGKKPYGELPNYLKAFDVCLMPFVISALTMHISPTKTPEYLSGGKPVVSTAIPDVIAEYSDVVQIASNHEEFIQMIEQSLEGTPEAIHKKMAAIAEEKSWRHIASEMEKLVLELPTSVWHGRPRP